MKYKIEFNYVVPMLYSNMIERVEQLAQEGWLLHSLRGRFAIYRKHVPTNLRCNLVVMDSFLFAAKSTEESRKQFRLQCEESGWTYIGINRNTQVYITKHQRIPNIQKDQAKEWVEVKGSLGFGFVLILSIALYLVFLVMESVNVINVRNLLTNSLLFAFFASLVILSIHFLVTGMFSCYWYIRNKNNLKHEDLNTERFEFSHSFAFGYAFFTLTNVFMILLVCVVSAISMSVSGLLRSSAFAWLFALLSKVWPMVGITREYGKKNKSNLIFTLIVLGFVGLLLLSPTMQKLEHPLPDQNEVILLTDLGIEHAPAHVTHEPNKSLFTTKQIKYQEKIDDHYASTNVYTFRSKFLLEWYLWELQKDSLNIPCFISEQVTDDFVTCGFLSADKKSLYFYDDTTIYLVSSSVVLEDKLDKITTKLLRGS